MRLPHHEKVRVRAKNQPRSRRGEADSAELKLISGVRARNDDARPTLSFRPWFPIRRKPQNQEYWSRKTKRTETGVTLAKPVARNGCDSMSVARRRNPMPAFMRVRTREMRTATACSQSHIAVKNVEWKKSPGARDFTT